MAAGKTIDNTPTGAAAKVPTPILTPFQQKEKADIEAINNSYKNSDRVKYLKRIDRSLGIATIVAGVGAAYEYFLDYISSLQIRIDLAAGASTKIRESCGNGSGFYGGCKDTLIWFFQPLLGRQTFLSNFACVEHTIGLVMGAGASIAVAGVALRALSDRSKTPKMLGMIGIGITAPIAAWFANKDLINYYALQIAQPSTTPCPSDAPGCVPTNVWFYSVSTALNNLGNFALFHGFVEGAIATSSIVVGALLLRRAQNR